MMLDKLIKGLDFMEIFKNILDILIIAVLLYYLFMFLKDRRAGKLAMGVLILFILYVISNALNMIVVSKFLNNIFDNGIVLLAVLFQSELRAVLEKVGGQSLKSLRGIAETKEHSETLHMIEEITEAVEDFSSSRTGALIAFERTTKLGDVIATGTIINADPDAFLIKNIFFNKAPLHDGAMVIRNGRIYAAGCLLPLSVNPNLIRDLGTRHRAGLGISENSDAVVVIVSEETGTVSLAYDGKLQRDFTKEELVEVLRGYLIDDRENGVKKAKRTLNFFNEKIAEHKKQK